MDTDGTREDGLRIHNSDEFNLIKEGLDEERKTQLDKEKFNDQYELLEMGSRVHTPSKILNRDFTLSSTDQILEDWANKQIINSLMIYDLLGAEDSAEAEADKILKCLIDEVTVRMIFTRSRGGKVLKAILTPPTGAEHPEDAKEKMGFLKRLFNPPKPQTEEIAE